MKKPIRRKRATPRGKAVAKKTGARKSSSRRPASKKAAATRKPSRRAATRKPPRRKTAVKSPPARKISASSRGRVRGGADFSMVEEFDARGLGPDSGGQSGDTEGLSRSDLADSESVEELVEEGQAFEAGIVSGVENAPPAGRRRGVRTRQVPEDDVPQEYLDED